MLSTSSTTPAIFKLNSDVLRDIFIWTIDDIYDSLHTMRRTSQVCSEWRNFILESPVLWGQAFSIDSLEGGGEWFIEVMKRTGTTGLHIEADKYTLIDKWDLIESVLDQHWARIRSVDLVFSRRCSPTDFWFSIFQRPAPSLETFRMAMHWSFPIPTSSDLFAANAPSLRTVFLKYTELDLSKQASWVANIRHLEMVSSTPISALLHPSVITQFHFLDHLDLEDGASLDDVTTQTTRARLLHLHPVNLPGLKRIRIQARQEIDAVLSLIANITPAFDCELDFCAESPVPEAFIVGDIPNILVKYLPYLMDVVSVPCAYFTLSEFKLEFTPRLHPEDYMFRFCLDCGNYLPEHAISTFLTSLTTFRLDKLAELLFLVTHRACEPVDTAIESFILACTSVEKLLTNPKSYEWIQTFQDRKGIPVFPSLKEEDIQERYF